MYRAIWSYVFDLSRNAALVTVKDLLDHLEDLGMRIVHYNWFKLPEMNNFRGRAYDLDYFIKSIQRSHLAVLHGISGIGKTSFLAKGAMDLTENGEAACWLGINILTTKQEIVRTITQFLQDTGLQSWARLKNYLHLY